MSPKPFTWQSAMLSHTGMVRRLNEDSALERPDIGLWVVADGMGGHHAGDVASRLVVESLSKVEPDTDLGRYVDHVEDAILRANEELVHHARESRKTSGTTVVALVAAGRHCVYLWAGDSRLYRFRDRELEQLTVDHSQVELYVEQGLLSRAEAVGHPAANMVTRAVGASDELFLDAGIQELADGDRFLLCSDGLDKHVSDSEIAGILAEGTPDDAAQQLIDATLARGASDNVTVAVVQVDEGHDTDWGEQ